MYMKRSMTNSRHRVLAHCIVVSSVLAFCGAVCEKADAISTALSGTYSSGATSSTSGTNQTASQIGVTGGFEYTISSGTPTQYTYNYTFIAPSELIVTPSTSGSYSASVDLDRIIGYTGSTPTNFSGTATLNLLTSSQLPVAGDSVSATFTGLDTSQLSANQSTLTADYPKRRGPDGVRSQPQPTQPLGPCRAGHTSRS